MNTRQRALWREIPTLPAPRAIVLLGLEHIAQEATPDDEELLEAEAGPFDPSEVAAATGLSVTAAATHLRELAAAGLADKSYRLSYDEKRPDAPPRAKVAYRPAELAGELEEEGS